MNLSVLYNRASVAARNAERMCAQEGSPGDGLPFQNYSGYPFYVEEYNQLLAAARSVDPGIAQFFQAIDLGAYLNPMDTPGPMWKSYAEMANVRLSALACHLQAMLGLKEHEHEQITDLITAHLRASIYDDPKHEREVQNALETIFRARSLDFHREKDSVPYSIKRYIPDFTFNRLSLAVEVKLCKDKDRVAEIIDEINADILGYAGRYDRVIFVVYDLGYIRDTARFCADIEKHPNTHVLITKR